MSLLLLTLAIMIAGITAIVMGQARRPRETPVWNDDIERRLLRVASVRHDRW